ncbi:MAG: hypothetical protein QXO71_01665 [Candidatus Jordarchaeaceae archaeon]
MSRKVFLAGMSGGIIGAITSAIGVVWSLVYPVNFTIPSYEKFGSEIFYYVFLILFEPYPYTSLFSIFSFALAISLTTTCILIGVSFYSIYKNGGGIMGTVILIFFVVVVALGALFILIGNLTPKFDAKIYSCYIEIALLFTVHLAILKPNLLMFSMSLIMLGSSFTLLGAATISIRELTERPSASLAGGILSIIGAVIFIIGGISGIISDSIIISIGGFALIFVAFILWTVAFYSSQKVDEKRY